ncbi:hypothetical protein OROGR_005258 [Orobanche gracilis]
MVPLWSKLDAISRNSKNSLWYRFGGGRNFDIHKKPSKKSVWHFSRNLDVPTNVVQRKRVAHILFFKIRSSQEILKIRDGTPMEAEEILTYIKKPSKHIMSSQEILKIPLWMREILTYIKSPQNRSVWHFYSNLDVPSIVVQKKRVARILFFKIKTSQEILKICHDRPSQEILKIRDGTPLEAEEILIYIKSPQNNSVWHFSSNLDVPTNVVQKKRVAPILFLKIRPSQEILKIRYVTPMEMEEILTYIKKPSKQIVARILFFKIRSSQEILKIRDGTPLEAEEILIYIKSPQNKSVWHFSSNSDVPTNVVQNKRVAPILFLKIRPSQEILKIRYEILKTCHEEKSGADSDFKISPSQEILKIRYGTTMEAISRNSKNSLWYRFGGGRNFDIHKKPSKKSVWHFSRNLDVPTNVVQRKRVAHILFFKIRSSQEILKIRDGTPMEAEEILTYIKKPSKHIMSSQEILKIPLWMREILTYIKSPQNRSVWHFYSNLDVPSIVVQKKRVARILFFKIKTSQEILKICHDRPSQEILKIRDGTPLEAEEILIYIKSPQNNSVWHFSSNLDVPTNVVQKKRVAPILFLKIKPSQEILKIRYKRVARILFFKIRSSQEILKIRDGTPLEAEEILIYIKSPQNKSVWHFSSNSDVPTNVVQNKRVAPILFLKIRPSQEILKIRYGTLMESEEILTYIKKVARILFFKIRPSQEILKICHGTPLETEEILTYIKSPQNRSVWHFSSNLDVPSNVVQKKRVVRILFFKIRPSQEILKIRDDTFLEMPSQEILKIRDGTPLEAEEILIYIKSPQNNSVWHFSSNLDVPTNVVQKKRVAPILFLKIKPSQEILKIRYKKRVARILFFKIRSSQEILKIRDGTPLEAEEILIYIKSPQNKSVWHFSSNSDVPTNVVQNKRVAPILFLKIRPSQEILKIRYGTLMESEEILTYIKKSSKQIVARILFFKIRPSQEILKICHGTPLETEEILTYIKSPQNRSVWHFSSNLDVPSNVVQKKRVVRILFFKIRPSQEILKIRDDTFLEAEEILIYIKKPSKQIDLAISRNSKNLLWYRFGGGRNFDIHKKPSKKSVWHFSSNLDVPTNVVQRKRVAHILFFKIRSSQEILKIRDGTPMEKF